MITQEQRDKAISQFRLQLNGVFTPFIQYGQSVFAPEAIVQIVKLALKLHERLNGNDVPIVIEKRR